MSERYNVYFQGEVAPGQSMPAVRSKLASIFNADKETLDKLFSGRPQLIKKACDKETALKFKRALEDAGAVPVVRRLETEENEGLSLAPLGADLLQGAERKQESVVTVDTAALDLVANDTVVSTPAHEGVSAPDVSHLSLAEPGIIPNLPGPDPIPEPALDNISLCPDGTDLSDCAAAPVALAAMNLEGLSVADLGSDMLAPAERKAESAAAPDVSHLSLN
ncbi:MAG: hypothetical protein AAGI11_04530 [Pseudomonadota bacterium]